MVAAIRTLTSDPAQMRGMGERARALVRDRFSPQVLGRQYVEFFSELIRSNAATLAVARTADTRA
jgi:glycosyltransferase involved in cell wall biosynthesis